MLLTSSLGLGDFVFREKKKYTENFIYSTEFRRKMRPNYTFDTKKPTKSESYQKPTNFYHWSQNGTRIKFTQKGCLASQRNSLNKNTIIINLKTNNYIINKKPFCYLFFINWLALFRLSCSPSRPYILIWALIGWFKR